MYFLGLRPQKYMIALKSHTLQKPWYITYTHTSSLYKFSEMSCYVHGTLSDIIGYVHCCALTMYISVATNIRVHMIVGGV